MCIAGILPSNYIQSMVCDVFIFMLMFMFRYVYSTQNAMAILSVRPSDRPSLVRDPALAKQRKIISKHLYARANANKRLITRLMVSNVNVKKLIVTFR